MQIDYIVTKSSIHIKPYLHRIVVENHTPSDDCLNSFIWLTLVPFVRTIHDQFVKIINAI